MRVRIGRTFTFDSAHRLEGHPSKCKNLHGHTYKLLVEVSGEVPECGYFLDFSELKKLVSLYIIDAWDHTDLNVDMRQPTAENMVLHCWAILGVKLCGMGLRLERVRIHETGDCYAEKTR